MIAVALNDTVKSLCPDESRIEPHTPFLDGGKCAMLQVIEESRNLLFELYQKIGVIIFKWTDLAYPLTVLPRINDNRIEFVIGTKYELGKEVDLLPVFSFRFNLVGLSRAKIFQPLGILPTTQ